ncbi:GSCOCG00003442001-RA-CDS [Cotesia congregata]|nr:GSCOCG00003442001-RA-CDS [Cotesia congregata]
MRGRNLYLGKIKCESIILTSMPWKFSNIHLFIIFRFIT